MKDTSWLKHIYLFAISADTEGKQLRSNYQWNHITPEDGET